MSSRTRPRSTACLALGLASLLAAGVALSARAAEPQDASTQDLLDKVQLHRCSVGTLRGSYGFAVRGFTDAASPIPPALQGPFAAVGVTAYDGAGNVTITPRGASFNGIATPVAAERGRYSVSRDCVVSAQYPSGVTTRGVLVDDGDTIYSIQTNAGTTIAGTSQRKDGGPLDSRGHKRNVCTKEGLAGRYGFLAEGFAGPPTLPLPATAPLVGNGVVTVERSGAVTLEALRSVGGVLDPQLVSLPGALAVSADCTVQMTFDVGFNFTGTVVDAGDEILLVETDPGTTLTVRARRQH